jgi:hypothetical protein
MTHRRRLRDDEPVSRGDPAKLDALSTQVTLGGVVRFPVERDRTVETDDGVVTWTDHTANPSLAVEHRTTHDRLKIGDVLGLHDYDAGPTVTADTRARPPLPEAVERACRD